MYFQNIDIPAALSTILATPDREMLITLTELPGLTSHLFALLSGVEEAV